MLEGRPGGARWLRRAAMSAWAVVRHEFESRHVQAFLLWMAFQTGQPVDSAGSGPLAYSIVFGRQRRSWTIPRGGSGELARALVDVIEAGGGEVLCDRRVVGLVLEDGRCVGVETADGDRLTRARGGPVDDPRQGSRRDGAAGRVGRGLPVRREDVRRRRSRRSRRTTRRPSRHATRRVTAASSRRCPPGSPAGRRTSSGWDATSRRGGSFATAPGCCSRLRRSPIRRGPRGPPHGQGARHAAV